MSGHLASVQVYLLSSPATFRREVPAEVAAHSHLCSLYSFPNPRLFLVSYRPGSDNAEDLSVLRTLQGGDHWGRSG